MSKQDGQNLKLFLEISKLVTFTESNKIYLEPVVLEKKQYFPRVVNISIERIF